MGAPDESLEAFHPVVAAWFRGRFGKPTEIQTRAWERIAAGRHCLISAATGSGKTMAAFLWGLNQLVSGVWELGATRVVYVSPLKALNNDIRRNLLGPLDELQAAFQAAGLAWPEIRVMTRSGDTEQAERRRMLRRPPEILITTPESLNLLLTTRDGQRSLLGVETVILDEAHAVVGSKRGVYLMVGVERLAGLAGDVQRVALSATVKPMETVARWVGGLKDGKPRPVELAVSETEKRYEITVRFPERRPSEEDEEDFWAPVVEELKGIIAANRSTLIFVNSRKLCEKIAYHLNQDEAEPIAYSHHGSLSKEFRFSVEQRLKAGELRAIVATNSLEMGIDVGALDCVVMVQCPGQISSAVQKVGRAGHQVGAVSRAALFPSHARDFLEAAVLSRAIRERDIESARPVEGALDVLGQSIVSILGAGPWDLDELYRLFRGVYAYRSLTREVFDLVVEMLAGRYANTRLRELKPRVSLDRSQNVATLRKGALMAYYFSGGVIPDRGYFHLRISGSGAQVGELDEEFVWERSIGDVFSLGVQSWRIERITHNDVFVVPAQGGEMAPPFWRAEQLDRDFHYSERIGAFLEWADAELGEAGFVDALAAAYAMDATSARALADFLRRQAQATGKGLPHRHHLLAEVIEAGPAGAPGRQLVLHTHWGGRVNRPFALALDAAWSETFGHRTEVYVNNDCVALMLSEEIAVEEVLGLVTSRTMDDWLRRRLEGSGFFGARFREAAGTSLLITRQRAGQRLPLWLSRMRSKKLLESVQRFDDFPLLLEAWRSCLRDAFDLDALRGVLEELEQGEIAVSVCRVKTASPFAASVAWRQINEEYMYATDRPDASGASGLREDLVRQVAFDAESRPSVSEELVREFEAKRQRRLAGYEPGDALELREWLRDRVAMPYAEWTALAAAVEGEVATCRFRSAGTSEEWVCLEEERERAGVLFSGGEDEGLLRQWLSYYGPVSVEWLQNTLTYDGDRLLAILDALEDEQALVRGELVAGRDGVFVCEAENFEILLRLRRARGRPAMAAKPVEALGLFLAERQGLTRRREGAEGLRETIDQLVGLALPVKEWEEAVLPARVAGYQPAELDSVLTEDAALWYGVEPGRVGICLSEDLPLTRPGQSGEAETPEAGIGRRLRGLLEGGGRYGFAQLQASLGCGATELEEALWEGCWKGWISNDAFAAARKGAAGKYRVVTESRSSAPVSVGRVRRLGRRTMGGRSNTYPGNWYALPQALEEGDAVERLDWEKERARLLLARYGVVFKELLEREAEPFRWRQVAKALRLLELSGEAVGGRFFEGPSGLQFASKAALRRLGGQMAERSLYWLSAADPASLCGLGLAGLPVELPRRLWANRLVYCGSRLVAESQRGGRSLRILLSPDDLQLEAALRCLGQALGLEGGVIGLKVETINEEDARRSVYWQSLDAVWRLHADHKQLVVEGLR